MFEKKAESFIKEFDYQKQARTIAENTVVDLTKENAELKAVEKMAIYSKMSDQIAKAKKIIKTLAGDLSMYSGNYQKILSEAEQFLKESK